MFHREREREREGSGGSKGQRMKSEKQGVEVFVEGYFQSLYVTERGHTFG